MGKAVIRNINNTSGGTAVPSPTGGASGGDIMTGTLTDAQTNQEYRFEQPLGSEEGLAVGSNVVYYFVSVNGTMVSNSVKPDSGGLGQLLDGITDALDTGLIQSVNTTDDGGTMLRQSTGEVVPFRQNYCQASGFSNGAQVYFELVTDPAAGKTAVALVLTSRARG
jgi:hypothetical protein